MSRFNNLSNFNVEHVKVTTSGTPVQGSDQAVPPGAKTLILAHKDNAGTIYIADNESDADKTATNHIPLDPSQSVEIQVQNTNLIWVDADNNDDKAVLAFER